MKNSFCSIVPVILKFAKVLLVSLYFLKVSPKNTAFSSVWLFFGRHFLLFVDFPTHIETAWFEFFK